MAKVVKFDAKMTLRASFEVPLSNYSGGEQTTIEEIIAVEMKNLQREDLMFFVDTKDEYEITNVRIEQ